jgi:hypothetical protein
MARLYLFPWLAHVYGRAMKAFTPRGLPGNLQTIAYQQVPPVNRGMPAVGADLRRMPDYDGGRLPVGTELRQMPGWIGGALPDDLEILQCPVSEGN